LLLIRKQVTLLAVVNDDFPALLLKNGAFHLNHGAHFTFGILISAFHDQDGYFFLRQTHFYDQRIFVFDPGAHVDLEIVEVEPNGLNDFRVLEAVPLPRDAVQRFRVETRIFEFLRLSLYC